MSENTFFKVNNVHFRENKPGLGKTKIQIPKHINPILAMKFKQQNTCVRIETDKFYIFQYNRIYSRLSRCFTARWSSSWLSLGGRTKVRACKSFLFTVGSLKIEN